MSETKLLPEPPDTIYLLDEYDQWIWCDVPDPDYEERRVIKYTRTPTWIKCSERLPETAHEIYLVHSQNGDIDTDYYDGKAFIITTVTHWMPLPDPPEGKE